MRARLRAMLLVLIAATGCFQATLPDGTDAGGEDAGASDAGASDAGASDAGPPDDRDCIVGLTPDAGRRAQPQGPTCSPSMQGFRMPEIPLPAGTRQRVLVDLDSDGKVDVVGVGDGGAFVELGRGDGIFGAPTTLLDTLATQVAAGDWNGDGRMDLAVADANALELLLQQPDAGFISIAAGTGARLLASTGQVGRASLLTSGDDEQIRIWSLQRDGGLVGSVLPDAGLRDFRELAWRDINGDGRLDPVVRASNFRVYWAPSSCDGFGPVSRLSVANALDNIPIADVNGDGRADLVEYRIYFGLGDGGFSDGLMPSPVTLYLDRSAVSGDLDGDGQPEIVVQEKNTSYPYAVVGRWSDGGWGVKSEIVWGGGSVDAPQLVDIDGDGALDLVVSPTSFIRNDGVGNFQGPQYFFGRLTVADLDGDGRDDLWSSASYVLHSLGDGSFTRVNLAGACRGALVGDLDGDRRADMVCVADGGAWRQAGAGDGSFSPAIPVDSSHVITGASLSPAEPGSPLELVAASQTWAGIYRFWPDAGLVLVGEAEFDAGYSVSHPLMGDLDGDGNADLIMDRLLLLYRDGGFEPVQMLTSTAIGLGDIDGDGRADIETSYGTEIWLPDGGLSPFGNDSFPIGDIDSDGRLDHLVLRSYGRDAELWLGTDGGIPLDLGFYGTENDSPPLRADVDGDGQFGMLLPGQWGSGAGAVLLRQFCWQDAGP